MNSKGMGGDFNFAWPSAEIAVMGPDGAVAILYRRELAEAKDPAAMKKELVRKYREKVANPFIYLAGPRGLEPLPSGVTGRRYNQLNYDPQKSFIKVS